MDEKDKLEKHETDRREFLTCLGSALAVGAAAGATGAVAPQATAATKDAAKASPPDIPGYNWNEHRWAFGVDSAWLVLGLLVVLRADSSLDVRWFSAYGHLVVVSAIAGCALVVAVLAAATAARRGTRWSDSCARRESKRAG